jgi:hypothetical protein
MVTRARAGAGGGFWGAGLPRCKRIPHALEHAACCGVPLRARGPSQRTGRASCQRGPSKATGVAQAPMADGASHARWLASDSVQHCGHGDLASEGLGPGAGRRRLPSDPGRPRRIGAARLSQSRQSRVDIVIGRGPAFVSEPPSIQSLSATARRLSSSSCRRTDPLRDQRVASRRRCDCESWRCRPSSYPISPVPSTTPHLQPPSDSTTELLLAVR